MSLNRYLVTPTILFILKSSRQSYVSHVHKIEAPEVFKEKLEQHIRNFKLDESDNDDSAKSGVTHCSIESLEAEPTPPDQGCRSHITKYFCGK
ncbi:unnamed protein product [Rotaria sp. Silwood2]|nr:unnamed protein product [Rotaria sp. Silwood2]CAF3164360.1 unnamed protein product [Rotaria sp. Silwood2]